MPNENIMDMDDAQYYAWLRETGAALPPDATDGNLVAALSDALREDDPTCRARLLVEVANMALTLADRTLGAQGTVDQVFQWRLH